VGTPWVEAQAGFTSPPPSLCASPVSASTEATSPDAKGLDRPDRVGPAVQAQTGWDRVRLPSPPSPQAHCAMYLAQSAIDQSLQEHQDALRWKGTTGISNGGCSSASHPRPKFRSESRHGHHEEGHRCGAESLV